MAYAVDDGTDRSDRPNNPGVYVAVTLMGIAGIALSSAKAIIIGVYVHDFGVSPSVAGYLLSVEMAVGTIGVILSTIIRDKISAAAALIAIIIGDAGTAFSQEPTYLFAFQALGGFGHGFALGKLGQGIAATANPHRASGLYTCSYLILSSFNAYFLSGTKSLLGPHALLLTFAIAGVPALIAIPWFPAATSSRYTAAGRIHAKPPPLALTIFAMIAWLLWCLGIGGFWPFVGQFADVAGIPFDERTRVLGSANAFGLIGATISLVIGNKFGSLKPLLIYFVLQLAGVVIIVLNGSGHITFMVGAWLYVFAWLGGFPLQQGMLSKLDPSGRLNAMTFVMANISYAIGPAGAAILLRVSGNRALGIERLQYCGLLLLFVSGILIAFLARRSDVPRRHRPTAHEGLAATDHQADANSFSENNGE